MKKSTCFILLTLICFSNRCICQVDDIGRIFTKRGYIQNINYSDNLVLVNFITAKGIESEVIQLGQTVFTDENATPLHINDFKSSDEIKVDGEIFKERKYCIATQITRLNSNISTSRSGRIDYIKNDLAIVDGIKLKLASGKKIKGRKKTGYEGKTFSSLTELKLGDLAEIDGDFNEEGFVEADDIVTAPDEEMSFDQQAEEIDIANYERFYPIWSNKTKRASLFNTTIQGTGKIVNDAALQEYVSIVGNKVIPPFLKKRTNFIFIVVENPELSATVSATGLAYVNIGLLKVLDNEAQLACVLGHEIAHVLYKHHSKELLEKDKANKGKESFKNVSNGLSNVADKVGKIFKKDKDIRESTKKMKAISSNSAIDSFAIGSMKHRVSTYSIEQELEADRVGLALMAIVGYDPREAPTVWKNINKSYEKQAKNVVGVTLKSRAKETITKDPKKDKKGTSNGPKTISDEVFTFFIKWKADDYKAKSYQTHPADIKRFEELNRLISHLWTNLEDLKKSENGEKAYLSMKKRLSSAKEKTKPTKKG